MSNDRVSTMTAEQHAKILYAYIARLSMSDLRKIVVAERECWHAQCNQGAAAQAAARKEAFETVRVAVAVMLADDRFNVETIIGANAR
jgi:hypothetical protein